MSAMDLMKDLNLKTPMSVIDADVEKVFGCSLEITHLVTSGCSWTYCQGLPDILNQGWPALVARKLNIPLVNLGTPGAGNDSIHRKTYEYVYENLPTGSNPLFIVAWSQFWRREIWKDSHYQTVAMPLDTENIDAHQTALLDNFDDFDHARKTYLYKLSLMNLFNSHKIPYLMTDFASGRLSFNTVSKTGRIIDRIMETISDQSIAENKIKKTYPNLYNSVNDNPFLMEPFHKLTRNYPKTSCGHVGVEGNKFLADYIIEELSDKFPDSTYINNRSYLTLRKFIKTELYMKQVHPEWCNFVL